MKRLMLLASLALVLVFAATAFASGSRDLRGYNVVDGKYGHLLTGEPVGFAGSKADTHVIHVVDFQTAGGDASWDGWTGVDLTYKSDAIWHIDTFNAANLDPLTVPNHAWWCGQDIFGTCLDGYGYGNNYEEYLDWYGNVTNPALATTVRLTAVLNYDNEPDYDYLYLQVNGAMGFTDVTVWNGMDTGVAVDQTFTVPAGDYVDNPVGGAKAVHLRFYGTSDGGWSDEDCSWPSSGLAQIDLIRVFFDGVQKSFENCEGAPVWTVAFPTGVGNFAKVWPLLDEIDPCTSNNTPQVAFIDDGVVVPGTGGTIGTTWTYGPGGYTVNPIGGLAGPDAHIQNEVWSPPFAYPAGHDGCHFAYTVYRHMPLATGIFYVWHVNSINDDIGGDWSGWLDDNFVYYSSTGDHLRSTFNVTKHLTPGRTRMRVALGVYELGWAWGYIGTDATPAPYFDDVRVIAFVFGGPAIATREIDIAQDNFPAIGILDYANLGNNSVRFDMANEISTAASMQNVPGDSIIFDVVPVRTGTQLAGNPVMVYQLKRNPLFNAFRTSGLPDFGEIIGDTTHNAAGIAVRDRFDFDLPDENFFFPGDVLHYYIRATDTGGGTSYMPGNRNGFGIFPGDPGYKMLQYDPSFTVRALPTMKSATPGDQPRILFWNDFANRGGEQEWMHALYACGFTEGNNLDVYYTNGPSSGVGNGLGGRATAQQLTGYNIMLYSSGDLSQYTISGLDYASDPGDDIGVLDTWLRQGGKGLFMTGDEIVYNFMTNANPDGAQQRAFKDAWMQVTYNARSVRPLIGSQSAPRVQRTATSIFNTSQRWTAYGGCPGINQFDAVTAAGSAVRIAEFLTASCGTGAYPYAAGIRTENATYNAKVVYLPYDLQYIYNATECSGGSPAGEPVRNKVLRDVLLYFGAAPGTPPTTDVPGALVFSAAVSPNPFNPVTKVAYTMPEKGRLTVEVYDLRGRLVTTLHDGIVDAGTRTIDWTAGSSVASGVYFVQVRSDFGTKTIKAALVK